MDSERKLKVFITDDDIFSLGVYEQYLRNMCISDISLFKSGAECLGNLHLCPDVIFLDHNMDTMNGFEVLKKVKRVNPNIYVVMVSAQENIGTAVESLKYGAFDYIIKSDNVEQRMHNVVNRILLIQEEIKKSNLGFIRKLLSLV